MLPDEPNDEERQEELEEDNGTPFRPTDSAGGDPATYDTEDRVNQVAALDDTHPATDTNIQPEELYDEGVSGAAEAGDTSRANAVTGYTPPNGTAQAQDAGNGEPDA